MAGLVESKSRHKERNMVNLLADFIRSSIAAGASTGGYTDNPDWRPPTDLIKDRMYERIVVYHNLITPQQFWLAFSLAKNNKSGGIVTGDMLKEVPVLEKILSQDPKLSSESLVNVFLDGGFYIEGRDEERQPRRL